MTNLKKMQALLAKMEVPAKQRNALCAYVLLAIGGIKKDTNWEEATNEWMRVHDVIEFMKRHYGKSYAENTRENVRKDAIHHFRTAAFIEDNDKVTNSPNYRYRLTSEFLEVIRQEGAKHCVEAFLANQKSLIAAYASKKKLTQIPITVNGVELALSVGKHNQLQKAIIEDFASRFAQETECLYVGDTTKKDLIKDVATLTELGFEITLHDKMPDVVLFDRAKNWLYFIEAVTSVGPMDAKRIHELSELTARVSCGKIFITAFPDFKTFKKFSESLAWETEVWIADMPDHMIHLNGDRFMGPR